MMRMLILFIATWAFVTGGLGVWRQLSGKEKWSIVKTVSYGLFTAVIAFVILSVFVILF